MFVVPVEFKVLNRAIWIFIPAARADEVN